MSTLQTINVKHPSSASNNVVLDSSGNTTVSGALTVSGNATITGTLQANGVSGTIYPLTLMTAQASTSGTFVDFTGIPSWVRRITVMFNGVSTNGSSLPIIQLGAGSITSSGYVSTASGSDGTTVSTSTAGFVVRSTAAANVLTGAITLTSMGSNIWVVAGLINNSAAGGVVTTTTGGVTLAGVLDRVRITTVNGTDVFDAGSINVMYE